MAVYTVLTGAEIDALANALALGTPERWQGVGAGIENSTYFLSCRRDGELREWVLTIAETTSREDTLFIARWMARLAGDGLPVPAPLCDPATDNPVTTVQGKPAIVVPRIRGRHPADADNAQCAAIGHFLGAMHASALRSGAGHAGPRGLDWLTGTAQRLLPQLADDDRSLLEQELARLERLRAAALPAGIIHGDLFRDNALFDGSTLVAVIDFFMAGSGPLGLDLAIAVNDWCSRPDRSLDTDKVSVMLSAYESERPLIQTEHDSWHGLLCLASTRFWVSRLQANLEPRPASPGALPASKDPGELREQLLLRRNRQ